MTAWLSSKLKKSYTHWWMTTGECLAVDICLMKSYTRILDHHYRKTTARYLKNYYYNTATIGIITILMLIFTYLKVFKFFHFGIWSGKTVISALISIVTSMSQRMRKKSFSLNQSVSLSHAFDMIFKKNLIEWITWFSHNLMSYEY